MSPKASTGALADVPRRHSGGSEVGERRAASDLRVRKTPGPWRKWRTRARHARAIRFVETYCRVPKGPLFGQLIRLARYQKEAIEELLADGVRNGGLQIPKGNAKSTTWSAVGLWAVCDHEDSPEVPLLAGSKQHAERVMFRPMRRMIDLDRKAKGPLAEHLVVYNSATDRRIWSAWNDGEAFALASDEDSIQGSNPTVALIDEAETLPPEVVNGMVLSGGKRERSLVLAIGTPKPGGQTSALYTLRTKAHEDASIRWIEFAADGGCAIDDRRQWRKANPAIAAGFLFEDALQNDLTLVSADEFRMYRLGQWLDVVLVTWLPAGAWEDCPQVDVPPDDTEIELALAGTWTSSIALVGCTLDGGVFVAWSADVATDDELFEILDAARERWSVVEVAVAPHTRPNLVLRLVDAGVPVWQWPNRTDIEVESSTEFRRAIVEGHLGHDHHPLLTQHVGALVGVPTADGSLRLSAPDKKTPVDTARAARMAWYRAREHADLGEPTIY
ncbi:MAG TPA: hypothetical protein VH395_08895 [Jatrophihabitantaceae bacterium]